MVVSGVSYTRPPGLHELLFKKPLVGFEQVNLNNYMYILNRSNAYYNAYRVLPGNKIQNSQTKKYRTIIKQYLMKKRILTSEHSHNHSFFKPPPPNRHYVECNR